jgi:hypothetical protein
MVALRSLCKSDVLLLIQQPRASVASIRSASILSGKATNSWCAALKA